MGGDHTRKSHERRLRTKTADPQIVVLAGRIRALRARLGLSQGEFARQVGVSQQTLSDWERGNRLRAIVLAMRLLRAFDER